MRATYELLQKQLTCLKYLEERVAEIYETLASTNQGLTSIILRYIARSSRNHAEFIVELLQHIGIEPLRNTDYCYDAGGIAFKLLREAEVEILSSRELSRESVIKVLKLLADEERLVGEELYVATVLSLILDHVVDVCRESIKALITAIQRDEEIHAYLVKVVVSHL